MKSLLIAISLFPTFFFYACGSSNQEAASPLHMVSSLEGEERIGSDQKELAEVNENVVWTEQAYAIRVRQFGGFLPVDKENPREIYLERSELSQQQLLMLQSWTLLDANAVVECAPAYDGIAYQVRVYESDDREHVYYSSLGACGTEEELAARKYIPHEKVDEFYRSNLMHQTKSFPGRQ